MLRILLSLASLINKKSSILLHIKLTEIIYYAAK
jgi:hypothetical protein